MKTLTKILIFAFVLRVAVSLLGHHGDVIDFYWWTRDLVFNGIPGFYDRYIANATQPIYPPVTSYLFYGAGILHELFLKLLWFLNVNIKIFPSNLIFWMESPDGWFIFNKLPAIVCDIGIAFILYLFGRDLKGEKAGLISASLMSFIPAFWYNSALWGQTESVFALPMIASFYFLYKNKIKMSMVFYTIALLTKPTALFAFPIYALWLIKKNKWKDVLGGIVYSIATTLILYFPFHPNGLVEWIFSFYSRSLSGVLGYTVANAFNLWALVFGFDNRPDTSLFLGVPAYLAGYILFGVIFIILAIMLLKRKESPKIFLLAACIISFSAFLFFTRMHERYFYPVLVLLIPPAILNKKIFVTFWALSTIHFLNLYHYWWMPKFEVLKIFFSNSIVEKILITVNIMLFIYLIVLFNREYAKNS